MDHSEKLTMRNLFVLLLTIIIEFGFYKQIEAAVPPTDEACQDDPCDLVCQYGFAVDSLGCKVCACEDPCGEVECPSNSTCRPTKLLGSADNKYTGQCTNKIDEACQDESCNLVCQYGQAVNSLGCKVCACEDPCGEVECPSNSTCRPTKLLGSADNKYTGQCTNKKCPDVTCDLHCDNGKTLDFTGCPSCNCLEPCAKMNCSVGEMCKASKIGSSNNFELQCVASTTTKIPETVCPHIQCSNPCAFGYKKENGCDSCECASDPCSNTTCPYGSKCDSTNLLECVPVENPCLELECRLECLGLGEFNKYKLNCSTCRCDNPCINAKCDNSMCFLEQKTYEVDGKEVKVTTGSCHDQKCPSLPCNSICLGGSKKDKFGCPSCLCGLACDKTDCGTKKYCQSETVFKMGNSSNEFILDSELTQCKDCPKLNCSKNCLYGWRKCETCECAENPCGDATPDPDKSCQALFFPSYAKPSELSTPMKNFYQDYIYLDKGDARCYRLRERYLDYFNLTDSLNCDSEGNFKPLQCSGDLCWCLDKDGNHTGPLETVDLSSITCGYYSKEYFRIISLDDMSVITEDLNWWFRAEFSKELARVLKMDENQIIITSIGKTKEDSEIKFIVLTSTKNEEESLANQIKDLSSTILNLTVEKTAFRFKSFSPINLPTSSTTNNPINLSTVSTTNIPISHPTSSTTNTPINHPISSTTNNPINLSTVSTTNIPISHPTSSTTNTPINHPISSTTNTLINHPTSSSTEYNQKFTVFQNDDSEETTKLLLLTILLPILVALVVFVIALIVGILVIKRLKRRTPSTTGSLFKEPIVFPENPKLDFDYHPHERPRLSEV